MHNRKKKKSEESNTLFSTSRNLNQKGTKQNSSALPVNYRSRVIYLASTTWAKSIPWRK